MSHGFVDQMLEKTREGELRSPVSSTLGMRLVAFARGEATYRWPQPRSSVIRSASSRVGS
jgi:hypothetical protein